MYEIPLLIDEPPVGERKATLVLAPGAGAAMDSPFMEQIARTLASGCIRVIRFDFPCKQQAGKGGKRGRPDPPGVLEKTWFHVVETLGTPGDLVIGGKSMAWRTGTTPSRRASARAAPSRRTSRRQWKRSPRSAREPRAEGGMRQPGGEY